jgi:hypothetical protein
MDRGLLSAAHFLKLGLYGIPRSGYIPPEAMATSLSGDLRRANTECLSVDQPQVTLPLFSISTTSPCPALGSRRLPPPPLTRSILSQNSIQRGQRVFGGDLGPDRCPSTRRIAYILLQLDHSIRRTTTLSVHQSKANAEGTGKGPCCIVFHF